MAASMATPKVLIVVLFCFTLIASTKVELSTEDDEDSTEQQHQLSPAVGGDLNTLPWTIYEPQDYSKSELCKVLNCRRQELCLVRQNNAICVKKRKLNEIQGAKVPFKSNTEVPNVEIEAPKHAKAEKIQHDVDEQEWDQQRVREKLINHERKLDAKRKGKVKDSMANEVQTDEIHSHERHTQKMGNYEECSEQQLVAIEARLVQWFADIHAQQPGERNAPLPKHKVTCREDIGWFFTQLDGDKNGKLSVDELNSLDNDPYEKCIKPFLDRCDVNTDDFLSLNEWCDCFQWADREREEPPCHVARRSHDPHLAGAYNPKCDVDGYYRPEQCHEQFCWCVDKWGREFDKSRSKGRPDCGQYAETNPDDDDEL